MKITRDVITDLMPVYSSGEASSDTRALVEEFFKQDPEYARIAAKPENQILPGGDSLSLPRNSELTSLARTRLMIRRRSLFLSLALMFTGLAVAFKFNHDGVSWLWSDAHAGAFGCIAIAAVSWIGLYVTRRRLRTTAL